MLPFDPFEAATQMNDQTALDSWVRFESALQSTPVIAIHPSPYLQHDDPAARDEYGPLQEIWEESIRQVVGIYEESFEETFAPYSGDVTIARRPYVPPAAYGKGGPFSFPIDVLELAYQQEWLMAIGAAVAKDLVVDATKSAMRRLRRWWTEHNVPENEQLLPSHGPFVVSAVVEAETRRCFPNLMSGAATIESTLPLDADYPQHGSLFRVTLPYPNGSIVYLIDDRLRLQSIVRTSPKGTKDLDTSCWLTD